MRDFAICHGLPVALRAEAAALYWSAFGAKLSRIMGPETRALAYLDRANDRGIKFALSNVLKNGDKENTILTEWLERNPMYIRHDLNYNYSNSSYHKKDRSKHSTEVLITNFE